MTEKVHVIIAPHIDDETIGCFSILANPKNKCILVYSGFDMNDERAVEIDCVKTQFENIALHYVARQVPAPLFSDEHILHFPDPRYETHPDHVLIGNMGMELFHRGREVCFYSVNMQAPYIRKVLNSDKKKLVMDSLYPSQSDMWKYEAKYYLFEGHCRYLNYGVETWEG